MLDASPFLKSGGCPKRKGNSRPPMRRTVCRAARRRLGWLVRSSRSARVRHVDVGAAPCHGRARPRVVVEQLVRPGESKPRAHTSSREAHTRKECHSGLAAGRLQDVCDSPIRFRGLTAPRSLRAAARWLASRSLRDGAELHPRVPHPPSAAIHDRGHPLRKHRPQPSTGVGNRLSESNWWSTRAPGSSR